MRHEWETGHESIQAASVFKIWRQNGFSVRYLDGRPMEYFDHQARGMVAERIKSALERIAGDEDDGTDGSDDDGRGHQAPLDGG